MRSDIQLSGYPFSRVQSLPRGFQTLDIIVVAACMVLIPSAVAQGLLGIDIKFAFALLAPLILFASILASQFRVHKAIPVLSIFLISVGALASVVGTATSQILMGATLGVTLIVGRQLFLTLSRPKVLRVVTWFTLALLVGGVVGILYAVVGGQPLFSTSSGYRTTYLYLTTFSFATIGDFIRPSGIFDEPGAFAMYVAIVTMFNDTLRQNRKLNNMLVIMMVFTGALAAVALAALYLLASNGANLRRKSTLTGIFLLALAFLSLPLVAPSNLITTSLDTFYSDRFEVKNGRLAGDNRSGQIDDFFEQVDSEMLLKGTKNSTREYESSDQSSNPFSIVYGYGVIISTPYFLLLLWLAGTTIKQGFRNSYATLGLIALLLQRPYIYNMYWSIMIAATVWLIYHSAHEQRSRAKQAA